VTQVGSGRRALATCGHPAASQAVPLASHAHQAKAPIAPHLKSDLLLGTLSSTGRSYS